MVHLKYLISALHRLTLLSYFEFLNFSLESAMRTVETITTEEMRVPIEQLTAAVVENQASAVVVGVPSHKPDRKVS